jgi:hypothetical protein
MTFTFNGVTYYATSISVSRQASEIDVSTLNDGDGFRTYRTSEIESCDIKVDWIGDVAPPGGNPKAFTLTSGLYHLGSKAVATGVTVTGASGDLVKGSATFKVSFD